MKKYYVRIPPDVEAVLRRLHPQLKAKIRNALEEIGVNPHVGKPLREQLRGLFSYRIARYRIVYEIKARDVLVEVIDIAQRKVVYQRVAELLRGMA